MKRGMSVEVTKEELVERIGAKRAFVSNFLHKKAN